MEPSELERHLLEIFAGADDWLTTYQILALCPGEDVQHVLNLLNWMFARGQIRKRKLVAKGTVRQLFKEFRRLPDGTIEP